MVARLKSSKIVLGVGNLICITKLQVFVWFVKQVSVIMQILGLILFSGKKRFLIWSLMIFSFDRFKIKWKFGWSVVFQLFLHVRNKLLRLNGNFLNLYFLWTYLFMHSLIYVAILYLNNLLTMRIIFINV